MSRMIPLVLAFSMAVSASDDAPVSPVTVPRMTVWGSQVKMPVLTTDVESAPYPSQQESPVLRLEISIDDRGDVVDVRPSRSLIPGFSELAKAAAGQWKYRPGRVNGKPVGVHLHVPVVHVSGDVRVAHVPVVPVPGDVRVAPVTGPRMTVWGSDIEMPVLTTRVTPVIPRSNRARSGGPTEIFEIAIDDTGNVVDIRVLKGSIPEFTEIAEAAVRQWKFRPGRVNGKPVGVYLNVVVGFAREQPPPD